MTDGGVSEQHRTSIRDLCASWRAAATGGGGIAIGRESEQFRLHANGIHFHDLTYEGIREAAVGLTDILLLPGMNTVVDLDHQLFWSWCGELLLGSNGPLSAGVDGEIRQLAETAVRASLANVRAPTREAFDRARAAAEVTEHNAAEYLQRSHIALPHLAFPLLEAVVRRACSEYVDMSGRVLTEFPRTNGRTYSLGGRCSNVADLLRLLVATVAAQPLKEDLTDVLEHIAGLGSEADKKDGYGVLFEWRNSSLHGETSLSTIGGTVLMLTLLIALDDLRSDYDQHRRAALESAQREVANSQATGRWRPSPWSYYPPFP